MQDIHEQEYEAQRRHIISLKAGAKSKYHSSSSARNLLVSKSYEKSSKPC